MSTYDDKHPVELAPGVFHLGVRDHHNAWANVPYLIVEGDESMLIDPGSARPEFYSCVARKVHKVVDPRTIKYMVVQHQDPDLGAALPLFEQIVSPDVEIYTAGESRLLVQHYGCRSPLRGAQDGDTLTLGGKREIRFFMTPYLHFVGSMITYDAQTKTLFTSDAFGGFTVDSALYAGDAYPEYLSLFLGQYLGSQRALEYGLKRIQQLLDGPGVERFCPQHGCVILGDQIPSYMEAARGLKVGEEIDRLARKNGITLEWQESRSLGV